MIYSFYGLRRSGNHAILEWLLYNMGYGKDRSCHRKHHGAEKVISRGNAFYFNDVSRYSSHIQLCYDVIEAQQMGCNTMLVTYEDKPVSYKLTPSKKDIVIVRDIVNVLASRIKNSNPSNLSDMRVDQGIIDLWKEHVSNQNCIKISYENWLTSKSYRDSICKHLSIFNLDNTDEVYSFGGGSSFVGQHLDSKENLLNRYKGVDFPNEINEMISDKSIAELRKKLGYIK